MEVHAWLTADLNEKPRSLTEEDEFEYSWRIDGLGRSHHCRARHCQRRPNVDPAAAGENGPALPCD
jgi:hypothetical protein